MLPFINILIFCSRLILLEKFTQNHMLKVLNFVSFSFYLVTSAYVFEGEICSRKLQGGHGFFQYLD